MDLNSLNPRDAQILELRAYGQTYREIGKAVDLTPGRVCHIVRALLREIDPAQDGDAQRALYPPDQYARVFP